MISIWQTGTLLRKSSGLWVRHPSESGLANASNSSLCRQGVVNKQRGVQTCVCVRCGGGGDMCSPFPGQNHPLCGPKDMSL